MMVFRSERKWQVATGLVGLITLAVLTSGAVYLASDNAELRGDVRAARADARAATANGQELYQQILTMGVRPVAEKPAAVVAGGDGKSGNDGAPGRPPTAAEVDSSVASYCAIRLDCTGATGSIGPVSIVPGPIGNTGAAGADSTTPGPVGATGADSTVAGPTGPTGPGIASIACQTDGTWLFTLTDTSTREVAGPCRVDPIAPPIEGATP